jgi:hypothetical protein
MASLAATLSETEYVIVELGSGTEGSWAVKLKQMYPEARVIATEFGDRYALLKTNLLAQDASIELVYDWNTLETGIADEVWAVAPNPSAYEGAANAAVRIVGPNGEVHLVIAQHEMTQAKIFTILESTMGQTGGQVILHSTTFAELGIPVSNIVPYWQPSDPAWHGILSLLQATKILK